MKLATDGFDLGQDARNDGAVRIDGLSESVDDASRLDLHPLRPRPQSDGGGSGELGGEHLGRYACGETGDGNTPTVDGLHEVPLHWVGVLMPLEYAVEWAAGV